MAYCMTEVLSQHEARSYIWSQDYDCQDVHSMPQAHINEDFHHRSAKASVIEARCYMTCM